MKLIHEEKIAELEEAYALQAGEPEGVPVNTHCRKILKLLVKLRHHDEFYTVYNLKHQRNTWQFAAEHYLGFAPEDLLLRQKNFLPTLIHPFVRDWAELFTAGWHKCLMEGKMKDVDYLSFRFMINLPIRKADGGYLLIKQISMPFEMDGNGRMVSQLNSFFIVDRYHGEPLRPRIFYKGKRRKDNEKALAEACMELMEPEYQHFLSPELERMIHLIGEVPEKEKGNLAKELYNRIKKDTDRTKSIKPDTVYKYLQRIREKLTPLYHYEPKQNPQATDAGEWLPDFNDAWTLVNFTFESGILQLFSPHEEEH